MKFFSMAGISILCCLLPAISRSQVIALPKQTETFKPSLFGHLPPRINASMPLLEKLFSGTPGTRIKIPLGDAFFTGTITEKVQKNESVTTVNIRSSNFEGALLTISRIQESNASFSYTGRIISIRHADVLMLTQEDNRYYFIKQRLSLLIAE